MQDNAVFTPAAHDISVRFLDFLLGPGWQWYIFPGNAPTAAGGAVGEMFLMLSTIMMGVMALMVVWVLGTGIIGTAHEGTPLGRRYSSIWTPLRGVAGASLLAPLPWAGGFSLLQAILLLFVYYGIGAGDAMLRAPMEYARKNMGILAAPPLHDADREITISLLQSLTARRMLSEQEQVNVSGSRVVWVSRKRDERNWRDALNDPLRAQIYRTVLAGREHDTISGAWVIQHPIVRGQGVKTDALGQLIVPCVDRDSDLCAERLDAAGRFVHDLDDVARRIASNYRGGEELPFSSREIAAAERRLALVLHETALAQYAADNPLLRERLERFTADIETRGWMGLGAYHWSLASFQERTNREINTRLGFVEPDLEHLMRVVNDSSRLAGYIDLARNLAGQTRDSAIEHAEQALDSGSGKQWSEEWLWRKIAAPFDGALQHATAALTDGDPVANLQSLGSWIVGATVTGYSSYVAASAAAGGAKSAADAASNAIGGLGAIVGAPAAGIAGAAERVIDAVGPLLVTILLSLFAAGAILAYYLPAVPFLIYLMGSMGWAILVLEVLVAAPIWALAHALPTPDGQPLGSERQGYMLFLRVLLQPALMVVGYFFGIVLFLPFGWLVGETYSLFVAATSGGLVYLLGLLVHLVILCVVIIVGAHKIFGLSTWLPDHVLRWIGGQPHSLGEDRDEQRISGVAVAAIETSRQAGDRQLQPRRAPRPNPANPAPRLQLPGGHDSAQHALGALGRSEAD